MNVELPNTIRELLASCKALPPIEASGTPLLMKADDAEEDQVVAKSDTMDDEDGNGGELPTDEEMGLDPMTTEPRSPVINEDDSSNSLLEEATATASAAAPTISIERLKTETAEEYDDCGLTDLLQIPGELKMELESFDSSFDAWRAGGSAGGAGSPGGSHFEFSCTEILQAGGL